MKLTLQLVVFVLNTQRNFRDHLLKFKAREGVSAALLPFQHNVYTKFELQR